MSKETSFDLSNLMTDTLKMQNIINSQTKAMFSCSPEDPYIKILHQDIQDILGETKFRKPNTIHENNIGTPIQEFFRGVNILITGATGFIGKMLTEKLLRSIPHIGQIYLIIREKRGNDFRQRFAQMFKDELFSRIEAEVPHYHTKVTAVAGDISLPGMGLSDADRHLLTGKIHVIFHSAADVRFIEPLRVAVASNVLGSKHVLELAKEMKHLKSYVHVSTAYSQCVRRVIDENVLTMSVNYKEVLNYIETHSDEELERETTRILQGWPNTYTFSKAVCESMLLEEAAALPICIFRPSVVINTYKEPVSGWTNNVYGPIGLTLAINHGVIHCYKVDEELNLDMVPVDYVVNCMIAAAWQTGNTRNSYLIPVYNFTSSLSNQISWKTYRKFFSGVVRGNVMMSRAIWYPSVFFTKNNIVYVVAYYMLHTIPGMCFDKLAVLIGQKPRLSKIYRKIKNLEMNMNYFISRVWEFGNNNVIDLWKIMGDEDRSMFYFDVSDIDYKEHFLISALGVKHYYLKEKTENEPAVKSKQNWLYRLHIFVKFIFGLAVLKLMVVLSRALPF